MAQKIFIILLTLSLFLSPAAAQHKARISPRNAESLVSEEGLYLDIKFLADSACQGRRTGTAGNQLAARWIASQFDQAGLMKLDGSRFQSFPTVTGAAGHNVTGFLPGTATKGKRYVIIGAHYDHQGILGGVLYPGADANASGVVCMIQLARMLSYMKELDAPFSKSILFVAFDAKDANMAGSADLAARIRNGALRDPVTGAVITAKDVDMMINIDQIGCNLTPLYHVWPEYLIMLTEDYSPRRSDLVATDLEYRIGLDHAFTYYQSRDFTRLFYRKVCDQKAFLDEGIESILFTSGITLNTNKPYDTPDTINTTVLRKRIFLIYYWLRRYL